MQHLFRTSALLCVLALLAWQQTPVNAEPKEGDWKSGWNTWDKAVEGDWVEYSMEHGIGVKQEIKKVYAGQVTYVHSTMMNGKETSSKERTKGWQEIKLQGRLPYGKENIVEWTDGEVELDGQKLKCTVASWVLGNTPTEIWFSAQVPCGGIVKTTTNGKDSVWLTKFKSSIKADDNGGEDNAEAVESELPKFYAAKGNFAVYQVTEGGKNTYVRHEVTEVKETASKWTSVACDKNGEAEAGATPEEHEMTKANWDELYAEPKAEDQELKTEAGTFSCSEFENEDGDGVKTTEWISDGLVVMKLVNEKGKSKVYQLVKYEMK